MLWNKVVDSVRNCIKYNFNSHRGWHTVSIDPSNIFSKNYVTQVLIVMIIHLHFHGCCVVLYLRDM